MKVTLLISSDRLKFVFDFRWDSNYFAVFGDYLFHNLCATSWVQIPIQYTKIAQGASEVPHCKWILLVLSQLSLQVRLQLLQQPSSRDLWAITHLGFRTARMLLATTTISGMFTYALLVSLYSYTFIFKVSWQRKITRVEPPSSVRPGKGNRKNICLVLRRLAAVISLF